MCNTVYKAGNPLDCNRYHPISVTSNVKKIVEKLVCKWFHSFLDTNSPLHENQYGFCNSHSTAHVLIFITEKDQGSFRLKEKIACGVYIDLQKLSRLLIIYFY